MSCFYSWLKLTIIRLAQMIEKISNLFPSVIGFLMIHIKIIERLWNIAN